MPVGVLPCDIFSMGAAAAAGGLPRDIFSMGAAAAAGADKGTIGLGCGSMFVEAVFVSFCICVFVYLQF